jgi:hypothetical protein
MIDPLKTYEKLRRPRLSSRTITQSRKPNFHLTYFHNSKFQVHKSQKHFLTIPNKNGPKVHIVALFTNFTNQPKPVLRILISNEQIYDVRSTAFQPQHIIQIKFGEARLLASQFQFAATKVVRLAHDNVCSHCISISCSTAIWARNRHGDVDFWFPRVAARAMPDAHPTT